MSANVCHGTGDVLAHLPQLLSRMAQLCVRDRKVTENVKNLPENKREIKIRYLEYEDWREEITGGKKWEVQEHEKEHCESG